MTFLLFPLLVGLAYWADKGFPFRRSHKSIATVNDKQIELGTMLSGEGKLNLVSTFCLLSAPQLHLCAYPNHLAGRRGRVGFYVPCAFLRGDVF